MLTPESSRSSSASSHSAFPSAAPLPPRAKGELILVADDQESVRDLLQTVLSDHGYQTIMAADGDVALAAFAAQPDRIAAVISDLHMPHVGGDSLADLMRRVRADIPILFMSGLTHADSGDSRPATSRDPFLLKPFRPVALLEAIHRLLQPAAEPKT
jgi:two-component system cell cycle sensor histidine kinase/response regulator CckA